MIQVEKRYPWFGIILILFGTALLLHKMNVIDVKFSQILWVFLSVLGFSIAIKGFLRKQNGKIFLGSFLFLFSILFILRSFGLQHIEYDIIPPAIFFIIGFSFLMMYLNKLKEYIFLILAVCFLIIGGAFVLVELGYIYRWDVLDAIRHYWPIVLIAVGLGMLFKRRSINP
ncbi:MAG: hypothetical protein KKF20_00030 [Bacteroidetes bacterium]|nr:hypothetical protein [Bacteroidota bacterium]MBU2470782.1 hypothetical protein [Bacteroidota bacterium]MBU2636166.1 hypothetical protein [Bacteroidota bacterium]MDI6779917.1 DUF5668 domain-containing protein [Bacteroidota bacterium]